ncbi:hypothetical protein DT73_25155 [Mangrovibacter sp. MFB070]|nr:hypothetical protein DT73_25155 [Mangrovibacter sp. MFB070]
MVIGLHWHKVSLLLMVMANRLLSQETGAAITLLWRRTQWRLFNQLVVQLWICRGVYGIISG